MNDDEFVVTDPAMAKVLSSRPAMTYFGPFLEHDRSVSEAAALIDKPLGRVHYWVRRLHDAGLLRVVAEVPRAGRPVKRYRAASRVFRVPARLLPVDHFEDVMTVVGRELAAAVAAAVDMPSQDLTISPGRDGSASMDRATDRDALPRDMYALQTAMSELYLTNDQAREFWTELTDLRTRISAASDRQAPDTKPYLIQLAMVPVSG